MDVAVDVIGAADMVVCKVKGVRRKAVRRARSSGEVGASARGKREEGRGKKGQEGNGMRGA